MLSTVKMLALVSAAELIPICASAKVDNTPVTSLDLNRFLGTWYEIARFDHSFESDISNARAEYTWILSRTPEIPQATLDKILEEAERRGYDTSRMLMVDQSLN